MKLLILTQKVDINDDVLGFFHGWIAEFAKHCEKVTVIALGVGDYDLPDNVNVLSLGKESVSQKPVKSKACKVKSKLLYGFNFYRHILEERKNYDKVFVHMNTEYVVLGGWLWKLLGKRIGLWYTHKAVNLKLRIAEKFVDVIFTASKESFRLKSKKVKVMGHGIPSQKSVKSIKSKVHKVESLKPVELEVNGGFKIITVGRISKIKDYETLINAIEILYNRRNRALPCSDSGYGFDSNLQIDIIGAPATLDDEKYLEKLKRIVKEKKLDDIINFIGSVPNKDILQYYNNADLFVNMSMTGSLDKVILEAMACGIITLSCNDASKDLLEKYSLFYKNGDFEELAEKIKKIIKFPKEKKESIQRNLKDVVVQNHNLGGLIKKLVLLCS